MSVPTPCFLPALRRFRSACRCLLALLSICASVTALAAEPATVTLDKLRALDESTKGRLGVYVKNLKTGEEIEYHAGEKWYLASLVKIPLAIAVLQAVENQRFSLDDEIALQESDFVDGSGDMLFAEAGSRHSIAELLKKSVVDSDSTATDMLMRKIGVDAFNQQLRQQMGVEALGPFTTILQVRYDAFAELHPHAHKLSNLDYVEIRSADAYPARVEVFRKKLQLEPGQLKVATLEEAFERYYRRDLNKGTLEAMGILMERLANGKLLNQTHTNLLLDHMENVTTGDKRLKGGLRKGTAFAQKTGTQINRACNMGITNARDLSKSVVIVVCAAGFGELEHAEKSFTAIAGILVADGRVP